VKLVEVPATASPIGPKLNVEVAGERGPGTMSGRFPLVPQGLVTPFTVRRIWNSRDPGIEATVGKKEAMRTQY